RRVLERPEVGQCAAVAVPGERHATAAEVAVEPVGHAMVDRGTRTTQTEVADALADELRRREETVVAERELHGAAVEEVVVLVEAGVGVAGLPRSVDD